MKHLIAILSCMLCVAPAFGNVNIKSDIVGRVVKQYIDADHQVNAMSAYNEDVRANGASGISAAGMYKVCVAAGWDIKTNDGYAQCREFVGALLNASGVEFFSVCGDDKGKSGGQEYCIDNFFTNKFFGGTQVQLGAAIGLAQEYARVKNNHIVECNPKARKGKLDYYIQCTGTDKGIVAYEFVFDDVTESVDATINKSIMDAVCRIHGTKLYNNNYVSYCQNVSSKSQCDKIGVSFNRFAYDTKFTAGGNSCYIEKRKVDSETLKTAFGVDNYAFYDGIQIKNSPDAVARIRQYVEKQAGRKLSSFYCDASPIQIKNRANGIKDALGVLVNTHDDVFRCYAEGQPIDFVFDDMSELYGFLNRAGNAGMECVINGGRYKGKTCRGLTKSECTAANAKIVGGTHWDDGANTCVLNESARAQKLQNGIDIGTGIVLTVGTFGLMGAVSVVAITAEIAFSIAVDAAFVGLERLEETSPHHAALAFMKEADGCNDNVCAYSVVANHFNKLKEIASDLNDDELEVVAARMETISALLSDKEFNLAMAKPYENKIQQASTGLLAATLLANPSKGVQKIMTNAPRAARRISNFASHADDIVRGSRHADDAAHAAMYADNAARAAAKSSTVDNLISKLGGNDVLDDAISSFRRDWAKSFPESAMSRSEWDDLNRSLAKRNLEFVERYPGQRTLVEYTPDNIYSFVDADISDVIARAKSGERVFIDVGDNKELAFKQLMRNERLDYDQLSMRVFKPDEATMNNNIMEEMQKSVERYTPTTRTVDVPNTQTVAAPRNVPASDYESGLDRINKFKEKYDLSSSGRMERSLDEWNKIFGKELGFSEIEERYMLDFERDYETLYNNYKAGAGKW